MSEWPGWLGGWALPYVCTHTTQHGTAALLPVLCHWLVPLVPVLWDCGNAGTVGGEAEERNMSPCLEVEKSPWCVCGAPVRREEATAPPSEHH